MTNGTDTVYISDLSNCQPQEALSETPKKGHWQVIPYEAEGVSGKMLVAGQECGAPAVTIPLGVQGWYAIHLGIWTHWMNSMVKVKLTKDACFTVISTPSPDWRSNYFATIGEVFWVCADLTGQDLMISQMSTGLPVRSGIAYLKLEALTADQVAEIQRDRSQAGTKRLVGYNDGWSFIYSRGPSTEQEIWEEIEPFRHTDFQKLLWGIGQGSATLYPSKVGEMMERLNRDDFQRDGDRVAAESFRTFKRKGIDPLKTAIDYAHSIGLELHGSYRVSGWYTPPPEDMEDSFFQQHPEWRCLDRDGVEITRMSYAFPGVQDYVISLFREVVELGADGISLAYVRSYPCVLYEAPVVDGFIEKYGVDPRNLPEDDPRWLGHKAEALTGFMRNLRRSMDETGQRLGRHIQLSAVVLNTLDFSLLNGMDVAAWTREGLVDFIMPDSSRGSMPLDSSGYIDVCRGTKCKVYPEMMPRQMAPAEYQQQALQAYGLGADGLSFWDIDSESRLGLKDQWSMVRRLGHKEALGEWAPDQWPAYRQVPMYTLGGYRIDRYSPYWAW
ncbi:MAG: family 10 glycosylhydrolase [Chloroflexi bacterium]|nr:family 10 glycosylhydrolase [Chloroflexota bacterium]